MGQTPVWGWAAGPVLNFAGTGPTAMESPNPHAPWSYEEINRTSCSLSVSAGEVLVTSSATVPNYFGATLDLFLVYTGAGTINLSLTNSGTSGGANGGCRVNGDGDYGTFAVTAGSPATMNVPYYRYRIRFAIGGYAASTTAWVKLAISFS